MQPKTTRGRPGGGPLARVLFACAAVTVGALGFSAVATAQQTAADTLIQNQARATAEDANGNVIAAESNVASITVAQVYAASLEFDRSENGVAGATSRFTHVLRNDGNGSDTYNVDVAQDDSAADDGDFNNLRVVVDSNGNGQPDAGEPSFAAGAGGTVDVAAGSSVNLIVQGQIPSAATADQRIAATLTAQAQEGTGAGVAGSVIDATANGGRDTANGTNEDEATVAAANTAVLETTKSAQQNGNTVTYTVQVTNTSSSPAYNVELRDPLSATDYAIAAVTDINIESVSAGLRDTPDDPAEGNSPDWVDPVAGVEGFPLQASLQDAATNDVNFDGTTGDFGVRLHDDVLAANTSITVVFSVDLAAGEGGDVVTNTATAQADNDDDGNADDVGETEQSNETRLTVGNVYAVAAADTGAAVDGDADATLNDTQTVASAPAGGVVSFRHIITNNGNAADAFDLVISNDGGSAAGDASGLPAGVVAFPADTTFAFFDASGNNTLLDSNSNGPADTGRLDPGASREIIVRAQLPANASGGPFAASLTATSIGDSNQSDTTAELLNEITAGNVDLTNSQSAGDPTVDADAYNGAGSAPITTNADAAAGQTTRFDLFVENDGGAPASFQLSAGSAVSGNDGPISQGIYPGWSVTFRNSNGQAITNTAVIPGGGSVPVVAEVRISATAAQALADFQGAGAVDGNSDGDGDYPVFFVARSQNSGAADAKLDAVDVSDAQAITLTPSNSGQVQPNGSITYPHILRNNGNTTAAFELTASNSQAPAFGSNVLVDTDGNGDPDSNFASLAAGDTIFVRNTDGTPVARTLNTNGEVVLAPGESLDVDLLVTDGGSAPGTLDTATLTATFAGGNSTVTVVDTTTVVGGQLSLNKFVALDAACDGTPDERLSETATSGIEPGQCAIWEIVATNRGTELLTDVQVFDAVQDFTVLQADSLQICPGASDQSIDGGANCTYAAAGTNGQSAGSDAGSALTFYVGADANGPTEGGSLASGAAASVRFSVQVQ